MCDPLTALAVAGSAASAIASYSQAQDLQSKQNDANTQWVAYQNRMRQQEDGRQDDLRKQAEAARQGQLDTLGADKQGAAQTQEADRLNTSMTQGMTAPTSATVSDKLLSGQASGGQEFKDDAAARIAGATAAARNRIKALANIQSYGGSFNGLQTQNRINFQNTDNQLGLVNDERNGSLKAFGVEQQVEPLHYQAGPNLFGSLAGALGSIAGNRMGSAMGTPAAPAYAPGIAPGLGGLV
jgi:hypothetical protein